jgi:hypothetical protein
MLRLFATPKTSPIFPAKICSVIRSLKKLQGLQGYNGSADRKVGASANRWGLTGIDLLLHSAPKARCHCEPGATPPGM